MNHPFFRRFLSIVGILSVLAGMSGWKASVRPVQAQGAIVIDGVHEADWGSPLATDPLGDMTEANLDLNNLYVVEDSSNYYIGFDAFASSWGMTYGIYIDTDQLDGSGATTDPWGRSVNAVSAHLPEHTLYVYHDGTDVLQSAQLNHWNGSGWSFDALTAQGGEQAYGAANDWIEYRVPKAALGSPARIALEVFTTGGDGHAQDTVPSDPKVTFTAPDWNGGNVTTLSAFALFPKPSWYIAGDFNGWNASGTAMYDDGANGDGAAGDGIYSAQVSFADAGRHEFKVTAGSWSTAYPSANSWLETSSANQAVTITFNTNAYTDGWLPATNIIGVSPTPGSWTAVGGWQGWNNSNAETAMAAQTDGSYVLTIPFAATGSYEYKAVKTGTWDAIGADGRSVDAKTVHFDITYPNQKATFFVKPLEGRVKVETQPGTGHDNNVEWDGLRHDSRDPLYRTPGGAVPAGTPVLVRFRTFHNDVTSVDLRVYDINASAQSIVPMHIAASDVSCYQAGLEGHTCDFWQATLKYPDPDNLWYRFIIRDGTKTVYYADNTSALDGGLGQPSDDVIDNSYALMFYKPGFQAPAWARNSVIYQIFPDRFRNGSSANDVKTGMLRYDDPAIALPWGTLPEGYCRNYAGSTISTCPWRFLKPAPDTVEQPRGRDYFSGDLKGVYQQLDYLQALGVTEIYFNPIFDAQSNHRYDTADYLSIDPNLGTLKDFTQLVKGAQQRGIRVVLDGVFNHMSSDSPFFDRYGHYPTVGACESATSQYRNWFVFHDVTEGTGTCVGSNGKAKSATYDGWYNFDSIPVLNKSNPAVQAYFLTGPNNVSTYWLGQGAAGWRLDVMGDSSFPSGYWETFRGAVKGKNTNAMIYGELWQKDSTLLRFLRGDRADSTMNYRLRDAVLGLLVPGTFDSKGFADSGRQIEPSEFAARILSIREDYPDAAYYSLMNLLDSHDTERLLWTLAPGLDNRTDRELNAANLAQGKERMKLASLIQFTMPGAPTVYYGDEVGMTGDDDPDDRRTFPWQALENSGSSQIDWALLSHYKALTQARNANAALVDGDLRILAADDAADTLVYGRKTGQSAALVAINRSSQAQTITIPLAGYIPDGITFTNVYAVNTGAAASQTVTGGEIHLTLSPMSGLLLATGKVDLTPPGVPTGFAATAGDRQVSLSWNAVSGEAAYNIYRSPLSGGGFVKVNDAPVVGTSFTATGLTNAQLYYFTVRALDAAGNESGPSGEVSATPHYNIGWADLQWPPTITHTISAVSRTEDVYGQVWIDGVTSQPGATPTLRAQLGYGPRDSNPAGNSEWVWVEATFNVDAGNNDEFKASMLPDKTGDFDYAYRYTTTNGQDWLYADMRPGGTGDGYDPANAGKVTVNPSADTTPPAAPANLRVTSAGPVEIKLAWDEVTGDTAMYEVLRRNANSGLYTLIAQVSGATTFTDNTVMQDNTYYYVVRTVDASFNRSGYSNEVSAKAEARTVTVVFTVTVPDSTDGTGRTVHIAGTLDLLDGGLPQWDPTRAEMTRVDATHWTITLTGKEYTQIQYKYALGDWNYVEKDASCSEIGNRILTLSYGSSGEQIVNDTVLRWRNVSPCGN